MKSNYPKIRNLLLPCVICATAVSVSATLPDSPMQTPQGKILVMADGAVIVEQPYSKYADQAQKVIFSRPPQKVSLHMDYSRLQTRADYVLPGPTHSSDIIPFTGKGVVIGVVDGGIDPTHPTFLSSDRSESRIKRYIITRSAAESKSGFLETEIYSTPQEIAEAPADNSCEGHGTHTASIAAGAWTGNQFYGIAPDADLVLVTMGEYLYDDEIIHGMEQVARYASDAGKPCTMNFSIGSTLGPHDGTGVFSLAAAKAAESGALIMASSGNDGSKRIAMLHDFSLSRDTLATICWNHYGSDPEPVYVEAWSSDSTPMEIALIVARDNDDQIAFTSPFYKVSDMDADGSLNIICSSDTSVSYTPELARFFPMGDIDIEMGIYPPNQRFRIALNALLPGYKSGKDNAGRLGFMLRSPQGATTRVYADGTTVFGSGGRHDFSDGIRTETISDLSIGYGIVSVGSSNTLKDHIINLDGDTIFVADYNQYGSPDDYTLTSSYGTSFDSTSQVYPHVLAPGTFIVAAYNSAITEMAKFRVAETTFNGKTQYWGQYTGTSMSSPAVAGIVALWLEANPNLTYEHLIDILAQTSKAGNIKNLHGEVVRYGIIDAYAGLKIALGTGVESATIDPDYTPRLMMRKLESKTWECVIAGVSGASGAPSIITPDGTRRLLPHKSGNVFTIELPDITGLCIISIPTAKGPATAKLLL